jgi:hypothetical protein
VECRRDGEMRGDEYEVSRCCAKEDGANALLM